MPLPFLAIAALATLATTGAVAGTCGALDLADAKDRVKKAKARHKRSLRSVEQKRDRFMTKAQSYGAHQLRVADQVLGRFLDVLQREGAKRATFGVHRLDNVQISPTELAAFQALRIQAIEVAGGLGGAALSGAAASAGSVGLVGLLGTASTGTAISTLSGAAAQSATLAWLGGGSLAAGGGGVAVGSAVLGGIAVVPAVFVGGFMLASKGEKALTEARAFESQVEVAIEQFDAIQSFLKRAEKRVKQLDRVLGELANAVSVSLDTVDAASQPETRQRALQRAAVLVKGVAEVLQTPVLDDTGALTAESATVMVHARRLLLQ